DARSTTLLALPVAVSLLTGAIGALGNTFYMGGTWRFVPPACALAVLGAGVKQLCALDPQLPVFLATGLATLTMGFAAAHLARRARIPPRALVIPGIAGGVLPGPAAYQSL
ncbi:threonine/serine exporter family protein, partial [Streptomyces californicus]